MANPMEPYKRNGRTGWYVAFGSVKLPDGTRRRFRDQKCEGRTKKQAEDWAWRERARIAEHGPRSRAGTEVPPTIDDLFEEYLERSAKVGGRLGKAHDHWLRRQRVEYCGTHGNAGWLR